MPRYLGRVSYTSDAVKAMISSPQDRSKAAAEAAESLGAKVDGFWFAFGEFDVVFLMEAPDNATAAALAMAIGAGLTSAITNALDPEVRQMVRAADVLTGNDPNCTTWITHNRPPDSQEEGAGRRRTNRRRGRGPGAGPEVGTGAALQAVPDPVD